MTTIAICEDNPAELAATEQLLRQELPFFFPEYSLHTFSSGKDLLGAITDKTLEPDLLFLDIYLEDTTGIQIAEHIRSRSRKIQIIFITSSQEYIMESYYVNATYYIVKPVTGKWLHLALERAAELLPEEENCLILKKGSDTLHIPQHTIQYVETFGNKTFIHTETDTISVYRPLREIEKLLDPGSFLMVQRGILANMAYIDSIQNNLCTLKNGRSYSLSRKNGTALREKYFDYLFQNPHNSES